MCLEEKKSELDAVDAKAAAAEPEYHALLAEALAVEKPEIPLGWGLVSLTYHFVFC